MAVREGAFPTADMARVEAETIARRLGDVHARQVAEEAVFVAQDSPCVVYDTALLPPSTEDGVRVDAWEGYALHKKWAVRMTKANSARDEIVRGYIVNRNQANEESVFDTAVTETGESNAWRAAVGHLFDCVSRQAAAAYMQTETLALLRRLLVKPTWPERTEDQVALRASLKNDFVAAFAGPRIRGGLRQRMETQRLLVGERSVNPTRTTLQASHPTTSFIPFIL